MKAHDLTEKLREKYVEDTCGNRKAKTVEEAFQEALDNTTPEHAGVPNRNHYEFEDNEPDSEWL